MGLAAAHVEMPVRTESHSHGAAQSAAAGRDKRIDKCAGRAVVTQNRITAVGGNVEAAVRAEDHPRNRRQAATAERYEHTHARARDTVEAHEPAPTVCNVEIAVRANNQPGGI